MKKLNTASDHFHAETINTASDHLHAKTLNTASDRFHAEALNAAEQETDPWNTAIRNCMMTNLQESEIINQKMEQAYQEIRTMKKTGKKAPHKKQSVIAKCSAAAAVVAMVYCVKNPTFAAQFPLIGHIFNDLEHQVSYPGDYSKNSIKLPVTASENEEVSGSDHTSKASYQTQSGALTVSLSEVTYDSNAIYLALLIENKDEFAADAQNDNLLSFTCRADMHKTDGSTQTYSLENGNALAYKAEGTFTDAHTFQGIAKLSTPDLCLSDYTGCDLFFSEFKQELTTGQLMSGTLPESEEKVSWTEYDWNKLEGNWKFHLDFTDLSKNITEKNVEIPVHDTNKRGFGIEKIVKTDYEMYAVPILPKEEADADYIVTIWDADGRPLESHGDDFDKKSIYGRDISNVTVYVLTWDDYMECKGNNAAKQPEKAVYQTTVSIP